MFIYLINYSFNVHVCMSVCVTAYLIKPHVIWPTSILYSAECCFYPSPLIAVTCCFNSLLRLGLESRFHRMPDGMTDRHSLTECAVQNAWENVASLPFAPSNIYTVVPLLTAGCCI